MSDDDEICDGPGGVKKTYKDWKDIFGTPVVGTNSQPPAAAASGAVGPAATALGAVGPTSTSPFTNREGFEDADNAKCERSKCDYSSWGETANMTFFEKIMRELLQVVYPRFVVREIMEWLGATQAIRQAVTLDKI